MTVYKLIPYHLLLATHSFENLRTAHMDYYVKYAGNEGLCTRERAYYYLISDLRYYNLPIRHSSYRSFAAILYRRLA